MSPWDLGLWVWGGGTVLLLALAGFISAGDGWNDGGSVFLGVAGSFALLWPLALIAGAFGFALYRIARRHRAKRKG